MKTYTVTLRHPADQYTVKVTMSARDTTTARSEAAAMHPDMEFVSVVLQES